MSNTLLKSCFAALALVAGTLWCRAEADWEASEWISVANAPVASKAMRKAHRAADGTSCFWRQVANRKEVKRAKWTTTGLGVYELYLNGRTVGDDALKPGFTHGKKTKIAYAYDVTDLLRKGAGERNDFGAEVSTGWWNDAVAGYPGQRSAFRCEIELTYADGSVERIGTRAGEWRGEVAGPVLHAGIYDGEEYDARETNVARAPSGAFSPGGCVPNDEFKGRIFPTDGAEICWRRDLAMKRGPFTVKPGETLVVDFGQNCSAVPRFRFRAARGTVLTALPGEMLNDADKGARGSDGPKGSVYRANLRMPDNGMRVVYTFAGGGTETYLPRFTFFGYRYLSITATDEVTIEEVASVPVTSIAKAMELGTIETGDKDVNRFIRNVYWGQLSNYLSVPTDCPQRDERQGWTADAQVFAQAGAFNADTLRFFRKWMRDMRDTQHEDGAFTAVAPAGCYGDCGSMRLGWSDAGVFVPYRLWQMFGDLSIVEENWSAMERYVERLAATKGDQKALNSCYQWGDWLSYEKLETSSRRAFQRKGPRPDAIAYWNYLYACHWLWDAQMMREMAAATGRDAAKYAQMAEEAKAYLKASFFAADDGLILPTFRDMQTPALFALKFGLVEGEARTKTIAALRQNIRDHGDCLQTGFLGAAIILDVLTDNGCADVAYTLLLQHKDPSWLYSVDQGATTVWERWNSYTKEKGFGPVGMNSFNHYAYGAILAWLYRTAAGIAPDPRKPGFRNIIMKPVPDRRLGHVSAAYKSAAGLIRSAWRYEGDEWIWEFTIPEGATASVTVPGEDETREYAAGSHRVVRTVRAFPNGTVGEVQSPVATGDFGADAFGWLEARASVPGRYEICLGERRNPDGSVDVRPAGSIRGCSVACDLSGEWTRVPLVADARNTRGKNGAAVAIALPDEVGVVMPFRYVEKKSGPGDVEFRRLCVHWPMRGAVKCPTDDPALRKVWDFCRRTIVATSFAGVMVDGDRERIPYEADLYINMLGQLYGVDGDPELARRSIRHVLRHPTWPTEWKQHAIMCVWEDWHFTGSTDLARECYDQLKREKLMADRARADGLLPSARKDIVDWPAGERDGYDMKTPCKTVVNAFYFRNLNEMADLARALGKKDDVRVFETCAEKVRTRFNGLFFDAKRGLYVDGEGSSHVSLHANVAALDFGLVPQDRQAAVVAYIASRGMACSPYFAQYTLEALCKFGRKDVARDLMTARTDRSWLGMMDQGATLTMEAWNLKAKPNLGWNHAWGTAPLNIIARYFGES